MLCVGDSAVVEQIGNGVVVVMGGHSLGTGTS